MVQYEQLKFIDAYIMAEDARALFTERNEYDDPADYFDFQDVETLSRIAKPQRWTLLHQFILDRFLQCRIEAFEEHRNDMLDIIVLEYEAILGGYGISYNTFDIPEETDDCYDETVSAHISHLRSLLPVKRIANDTFQVLFGDREFLLGFNNTVAGFVKQFKKRDFPYLMKKDGVLRRAQLPSWAKRGIFHRDRGRCINCGRDLTGALIAGEQLHYDHIVSLAEGGTNDPTNFQLLCEICNLKKSWHIKTSDQYPVYWKVEL